MSDCVLSQNPDIPNLAAEQQNLVTSIRVFCDNLEPSSSPDSAPASEPLAPPSEAPESAEVPESAEAPESFIPFDPPESAPPSEDVEPSIEAEPSMAVEPSVEAPFSEPVESPDSMDSEIAPMSDGSPKEAEKDTDEDEKDTIEALDLF